mgnify:CR=1 FL=1
MDEGRQGRLLWILKAPVAGRVKTRLAEGIGADAALAVYRRLVDLSWRRLAGIFPGEVHFDPPEAEAQMRGWLGGGATYHPQAKGHLGERIESAIRGAFGRSGEPVVVLGGDCPYLDRSYVTAAFRGLSRVDVVVGPALDGGYVLIGMKREQPALFRGIDWGSDSVLEQTLRQARKVGLTVKQLAPLEDVDDASSWERARRVLGL